MPEQDRPEAAEPATAVTVTPPRVPGEARSFRTDAQAYTFIEEHRAPPPSDEDRVSRR